MLPWLPFFLVPAFAYPAYLLAFVVPGKVGPWFANAGVLFFIAFMLVVNRKTNAINDTWGAGAWGEFRVGEELEKLHRSGFHVFHDWYSGRGNVDHFVVGPQGIFAIETKAWTGRISCRNGEILEDGEQLIGKSPIRKPRVRP